MPHSPVESPTLVSLATHASDREKSKNSGKRWDLSAHCDEATTQLLVPKDMYTHRREPIAFPSSANHQGSITETLLMHHEQVVFRVSYIIGELGAGGTVCGFMYVFKMSVFVCVCVRI